MDERECALRADCEALPGIIEEIDRLEKERADAYERKDRVTTRRTFHKMITKSAQRDLLISSLIHELRLEHKDKQFVTDYITRKVDWQDIIRIVSFLAEEH